jgi:TonB family protein
MRVRVVLCIVALIAVADRAFAAAVDDVAKLYAEAYYDEALALADRAEAEAGTDPADLAALRRFKLLCQVALGREADARATAGAVAREAPIPLPAEADLPPPVRELLRDVRMRVVPGLVRERYQHGRQQFEEGAFAGALEDFDAVILLIDQESLDLVSQPDLVDLRVLAAGFRDLSRGRIADPAPAARPAVPRTSVPADAAGVAAGPDQPVPPPPLGPPEAIRQDIPARPPGVPVGNRVGVLEITITTDGTVADARMVTSIHPLYDALLLRAARNWRYRPATIGGVATAITKVITINLALER